MSDDSYNWLVDNTDVMKEWNYLKNEKNGINPDKFKCGSHMKVWWKCEKGHEWETSIRSRISGSECPYCSGRKPIVGETDLATTHFQLAKEWHPTKNEDLLPENVTKGSDKKVWWRCKEGHEWQATVSHRVNGTKCPYCTGRLPIEGKTDLLTVNPQLAKEWHPTKNGSLNATNVTKSSAKKIWWECEKGHEWEATINYRARGRSCPECTKIKQANSYILNMVSKHGSLASNLIELTKEWHPTLNGKLTPDNVSIKSSKKIWWKCQKCGFEWKNTVANRTNGSGCPVCSKKKGIETRIKNKIDSKGSLGSNYPKLIEEWHPTLNGELSPYEITYGSEKKVWWKCIKGHEWEASPNSRTNHHTNCPICNLSTQSSFPEQAIFFYLKQVICAKNKVRYLGKEIDVYLPELNVGIEYNGKH